MRQLMQTLVERVKISLVSSLVSSTERQSMQSSLLEMRQHDRRTHKLKEHLLAGLLLIQLQQVLIYFEQMV